MGSFGAYMSGLYDSARGYAVELKAERDEGAHVPRSVLERIP